MKVDLSEMELAELRRGLAARRKNVARRKPSDKPGEASSTAMAVVAINNLDAKLAVVIADAAGARKNGDGR